MLINLVYIVVGIALVIWGADRLTEGASSLARGMRVPEIFIGLTIVAAGTSAPELFVSLVSALKGTSDLAVGNVIGSNIFNTTLIVGCSAVVAPMVVAKSTVKKDIPWAAMAALLLALLCVDDMNSPHLWGNEISRSDGFILLFAFVAFMVYTFNVAKKEGQMPSEEELEDLRDMPKDYSKLGRNIFWIVLGLACLILGSDLFVNAASYIAHRYGVRQSVVAAYKGRSAIAIGNVLGSNVFNILLILGLTAVVHPMRIMGITIVDLTMMVVSMGLLWMFAFTKYYVSRREGSVLIASFAVYMCWLFYLL